MTLPNDEANHELNCIDEQDAQRKSPIPAPLTPPKNAKRKAADAKQKSVKKTVVPAEKPPAAEDEEPAKKKQKRNE